MDQILSQFGIQPILLLAQTVNFLVLLFILNKLLYKPLLKVLSERRKKIEQSLKNAEDIEKRLNDLSMEEQKRILKAAQEAELIIKQAQEAGVQILEEAKVKAESVGQEMLEQGRAQTQVEKEKMQAELKEGFASLVEMSLRQVVKDSLSPKDQKEILQKATKQIKI